MHPTIGRVVHVFTDPHHNNGADVAPAMITRVWEPSADGSRLVNVRVIHDGPAQGHEHRQDWLTSIPLHDTREAAEAAHAEKWADVSEPSRSAVGVPFAAFWPPRA